MLATAHSPEGQGRRRSERGRKWGLDRIGEYEKLGKKGHPMGKKAAQMSHAAQVQPS